MSDRYLPHENLQIHSKHKKGRIRTFHHTGAQQAGAEKVCLRWHARSVWRMPNVPQKAIRSPSLGRRTRRGAQENAAGIGIVGFLGCPH